LSDFVLAMLGAEEDGQRDRNDKNTGDNIDDTGCVEELGLVNAGTVLVGVPHLVGRSALKDGDEQTGCVIAYDNKCSEVVDITTETNPERIGLLEQSAVDEEERELREQQ
jgi:hypothetical protein